METEKHLIIEAILSSALSSTEQINKVYAAALEKTGPISLENGFIISESFGDLMIYDGYQSYNMRKDQKCRSIFDKHKDSITSSLAEMSTKEKTIKFG